MSEDEDNGSTGVPGSDVEDDIDFNPDSDNENDSESDDRNESDKESQDVDDTSVNSPQIPGVDNKITGVNGEEILAVEDGQTVGVDEVVQTTEVDDTGNGANAADDKEDALENREDNKNT